MRHDYATIGAGLGCLAVAGALALAAHTTSAPAVPPRQTVTVTIPACVLGPHGEADRKCTPGRASGRVTQANLGVTICARPVPGQKSWIADQRPPSSYTSRLRDLQMTRYYSVPTPSPTTVREDHVISLELGGDPTDPTNLYPQPALASFAKDRDEGSLHAQVCAGTLTLAAAQQAIVEHWTH